MEGNPRANYYAQDSMAAEMLNKLQNGSGFTTVTVPEGFSLQHPHAGSALLSGSAPTLNSSLITPTINQGPSSGDSVVLNAATSLDPALTQFLVAAQPGSSGVNQSSAATLVTNIPSVLAANVSATLPTSTAQLLHPVLSATLAPVPSQNLNTEVMVPADPNASNHPYLLSSEAMTITVHCTMSDTVIVVGQQNWQCCMCRDICGFDTSIDQHLALKHNLHVKSSTLDESRGIPKDSSTTSCPIQVDGKAFVDNKMHPTCAEPLQTISEQTLASLQNPETSSGRTGLEREVALLMAQTFTHSGNIELVSEEVKNKDNVSVQQESSSKAKDSVSNADVSVTGYANNGDTDELVTDPREGEDGAVYGKMINKVERAILATMDSDAKNDLLLVATELARMQKESTSKRRQMKKSHRYIPCPECGKEVRNRKDLIKQHNRCHEKTKKYRCRICNKMFKYLHTLRRHVLQQGHKGGMPVDVQATSSLDLDPNEVSVTVNEVMNLEKLVKTEVDEAETVQAVIDVGFSSLTSGPLSVSSEIREDHSLSLGEPAYEKILATLLAKGELNRSASGKKLSLLQCFVCDREIRNRNYYITRHARCHLEDLCYRCNICGKEFYRSDFYREHMDQHETSLSMQDTKVSSGSKEKNEQVCQENPSNLDHRPKKARTSKPTTVPCKICGKGIFNRTYNIKRHARQHSILEWESILKSSPSSKPQTRSSTSSQRSMHCGICGQSFKTYTLKRRHMLKHRSRFSCRLCALMFDSGAELKAHNQVCKKNFNTAAGIDLEQGQHSRNGHGSGSAWRKHAQGQASSVKKWTCPVCHASIIHTMQSISRHMRELHSEGQPHNCPKCNRTYSSFHKMQRHLKSHGDTGGICDVCGKVFQTKAALRGHTKLHGSPEGMFQCPKCPTSFRFQGRLEKHMRKHDENTDVCPHCGKVYISKIHLQRHISVEHMGVKDYRHKCVQCGAQFFESVQLRDHIAYRHDGVQLYTCKYCHKGFNCRPTLVRHERKEHTNYLPYKCKHCSQGFPEKSKLIAHEMTHTGMSPHKCDICGKYFTTGSALKAHKNLHLGVKPFVCSECGKTYLKNWHLQQHLRKAHPSFETTVYNVPVQNQQGQDITQLHVDQKNIVPVVSQPCIQTADTKFLQATVQGKYVPVHSVDGNASIVQQASDLQPASQNLIQSQGSITVQQAVVYP